MDNKIISIKDIKIANHLPFTLIAGPCQVESLEHTLFMTEKIKHITDKLGINFIFKASFDKANRTSAEGIRGPGIDATMKIFSQVKKEFDVPILTDIHKEEQCAIAAEYVDILQVPAFLCRQTDLLKSAAQTGKIVNVKKGQFLAPWDTKNIVAKLQHFKAKNIMLTERGASFGYNTLVTDMRSLPIMAQDGVPVVFDATHAVQQPSGQGGSSGGQREFVEVLSKAAIAVGIAALFTEVHQDPENAPSDGPCMVILDQLEAMLIRLKAIDDVVKNF